MARAQQGKRCRLQAFAAQLFKRLTQKILWPRALAEDLGSLVASASPISCACAGPARHPGSVFNPNQQDHGWESARNR
jgi:hypothetical protein